MLTEVCPATGETDVYGVDTIWFSCFEKFFADYMYRDLQSLPGMYQYLKNLPLVEYDNLRVNFYMKALKNKYNENAKHGKKDFTIEYSDFTYMYTVLHYIEIVMTQFDSNKVDNVIDYEEANVAFERFRELFADFADKQLAKTALVQVKNYIALKWQNLKTKSKALFSSKNSNEGVEAIGVQSLTERDLVATQNIQNLVTNPSFVVAADQQKLDLQSKGFFDEVVKATFLLVLADGDLPSTYESIYEALRFKMGLGYSSKITNLMMERDRLMIIFTQIIDQISTRPGGVEPPPFEPIKPEEPKEDDFRMVVPKK